MSDLSLSTIVSLSYEQAISAATEALAEQGFGVLTEIDVKATMKKKLDIDFANYMILGACKPAYAYKVLTEEPELGVMLPCNVIIYEKDNQVIVSAMDPAPVMAMLDNDMVKEVANQVRAELNNVILTLASL